MIFLTLSFDKYDGYKWVFLEHIKPSIKNDGYLQTYSLTIYFKKDIHPIALLLISTSPITAMIGLYFGLLFSDISLYGYIVFLILFFTSLEGLAPSNADYDSIMISYRKLKAYYLKKKRVYIGS